MMRVRGSIFRTVLQVLEVRIWDFRVRGNAQDLEGFFESLLHRFPFFACSFFGLFGDLVFDEDGGFMRFGAIESGFSCRTT